MTDSLLEIDNLSVGFESQVVFRRVSFNVAPYGSLALMGPSGVGKSTLLRTLGRWNDLRPSFWAHGEVRWGERELLREVEREEAQGSFAFFQQKARLFTATVLDNAIANIRGEKSYSKSEKVALARQTLGRWNLWERFATRLDEPVTELALAEQRMLGLSRLASDGAPCILADEPLRDVEAHLRGDLLQVLHQAREELALVFTTHNLQVAKELGHRLILLAGGTLVEKSSVEEFFKSPQTDLGRKFLSTGTCWPKAEEQDLEWREHIESQQAGGETTQAKSKTSPSWFPTAAESVRHPGGFHWLDPGLLGGTQWPGLLQEKSADLDGLSSLGVRHLVNLTERTFPPGELLCRGIESTHFPIVDMSVPSPEACLSLCKQVQTWIDRGEATVFHCRAGLGRTGTLLACMRVLRGEDAVVAVDTVRRVNQLYIQSQEQLEFVKDFASYIVKRSLPPSPSLPSDGYRAERPDSPSGDGFH